jgi:hypothetical protein
MEKVSGERYVYRFINQHEIYATQSQQGVAITLPMVSKAKKVTSTKINCLKRIKHSTAIFKPNNKKTLSIKQENIQLSLTSTPANQTSTYKQEKMDNNNTSTRYLPYQYQQHQYYQNDCQSSPIAVPKDTAYISNTTTDYTSYNIHRPSAATYNTSVDNQNEPTLNNTYYNIGYQSSNGSLNDSSHYNINANNFSSPKIYDQKDTIRSQRSNESSIISTSSSSSSTTSSSSSPSINFNSYQFGSSPIVGQQVTKQMNGYDYHTNAYTVDPVQYNYSNQNQFEVNYYCQNESNLNLNSAAYCSTNQNDYQLNNNNNNNLSYNNNYHSNSNNNFNDYITIQH